MSRTGRVAGLTICLLLASCFANGLLAQESATRPVGPSGVSGDWSRHHCLMILGLPGDLAHQQSFRKLADSIYEPLVRRGFLAANITVLSTSSDSSTDISSSKKESIQRRVGELAQRLETEDALWVIFIGHADHDGEHARFHIPGPDLRAIDFADLFDDLNCKEQVFWLTMSSSGWFTEPLSKENRIVVTATTRDAEPNETEFPAAFAGALSTATAQLDRDQDGNVSVLEIFAKTHELTEAAYKANNRAPTEHATIDDNADGKGTEWEEILAEQQRIAQLRQESGATAPSWTSRIDGPNATRVRVPNNQLREDAAEADVPAEQETSFEF